MVFSNVGLFYAWRQSPLCPDIMLALDVRWGDDLSIRENRSYFAWIRNKVPDVVIETVSDQTGDEDTYKLSQYANWGIPYYVIFDPEEHLGKGVLRAFVLHGGVYEPTAAALFPTVGLGLTLWSGEYEGQKGEWLRWHDRDGRLILTGHERAEQERQRAEQLEAEIARLRALLESKDRPQQSQP